MGFYDLLKGEYKELEEELNGCRCPWCLCSVFAPVTRYGLQVSKHGFLHGNITNTRSKVFKLIYIGFK